MVQGQILEIHDLVVSSGHRRVLDGVTLDVRDGEAVAVFGQAEAGKTALAAVICGALAADEGEIVIGERLALGVACQRSALARDLTLQENYEMFSALGGLPRKKRSGRIASVIEDLGLSPYRARLAGELSHDVPRLAEVGKALLPDAALILLDSSLDGFPTDWIETAWRSLSERRRERGAALLITTHDDRIAGLCDRVALIHEGRILRIGPPDELRSLAKDEEVLIEPLLNSVLARRLEERSGFAIEERADGVYIGARPESADLARLLADQSGIGCVRLRKASFDDVIRKLSRKGGVRGK